MTFLVAEHQGLSCRVAAGLVYLGGLGVTLPLSSAKRFRLLPEVCDVRSLAFRALSPHEGAIIREVNETVFHFMETGGVVGSE